MPPEGAAKWFNNEKGYGFISPDDGSEDVFVHHTGIAGAAFRSLDEGEKVTYEVVRGKRGVQAENVFRAPSSSGRSFERRDTLTVSVEVEAAARVLAQYFDPDELLGRRGRRFSPARTVVAVGQASSRSS